MRLILVTLLALIISLMLVGSASAQSAEPPPQINNALADLATRLGRTITVANLDAWEFTQNLYTDTALGCALNTGTPRPEGISAYTFRITFQGVQYDYRVALDGSMPYAPWRSGNRLFAFATQNPDHQWCGATLGEDLSRRRAALARLSGIAVPDEASLAALAAHLGASSIDQHLYELPLVARKRLSWLWPLSGELPWIMFDEPTIGQDRTIRALICSAASPSCDTTTISPTPRSSCARRCRPRTSSRPSSRRSSRRR